MTTMREHLSREPLVGTCPCCDADIRWPTAVITYDAEDEWPRMLAECPDCERAVTPQ